MYVKTQKQDKDKQGRAWQRMLSGRRLDLLDPSPLDIEIEDIAHGLSRVARWNGQTNGPWPFSVAQHSLLVLALYDCIQPRAEQRWRLAALLHDAAEYVVGDLISPFKAAVGTNYKALEQRLDSAIRLRFGLPALLPDEIARTIKRADRASAYFEAISVAGFDVAEAGRIFDRPRNLVCPEIHQLSPSRAKRAFLERFRILAPK
ncbi:MAG: HD domain-containing protein [Alphaproteobacteria bacterium]